MQNEIKYLGIPFLTWSLKKWKLEKRETILLNLYKYYTLLFNLATTCKTMTMVARNDMDHVSIFPYKIILTIRWKWTPTTIGLHTTCNQGPYLTFRIIHNIVGITHTTRSPPDDQKVILICTVRPNKSLIEYCIFPHIPISKNILHRIKLSPIEKVQQITWVWQQI